jgi:hypothetical protein
LKPVGELRVIEAETVEDGRLKIVNVNLVLRDMIAQVIRLSVANAGLDTAARHPNGETMRVMIASEEF